MTNKMTTTLFFIAIILITCATSTGRAASAAGLGEFVDSGHLVWTAIGHNNQAPTRSEVDLWTKTSSGCPCPGGGGTNKNCACCAHEGACQCGPKVPYRCAQCGLEQHCDQMCNVTLDAGRLFAASKLRYGQIKSLELHENQVCWFKLQPEPGYRVELQIYRLVDMGLFVLNQSRCVGGQLEWMTTTTNRGGGSIAGQREEDGNSRPGPHHHHHHVWTLCGPNERYSPPSLFFSDDDSSPALLVLKSGESTRRGKLLAHFSFTPIGHQAPLGLQIVGATPILGSDCDWHYAQSDCMPGGPFGESGCRMASPGYPGLYPPDRTCRYHVALQTPFHPLTLQFTSVQLPPQRCRTDNVKIFVNGRLHTTLCGQQGAQLTTFGPDVTVEFNSGPFLLPYVFNGFLAQLLFRPVLEADQQQPQPHHPARSAGQQTPAGLSPGAFRAAERQAHAVCDYIVRSNGTTGSTRRSGFFTTANTAWKVWPAPCSFIFPVQPGQSLQIHILAYNLTGEDCSSFFEIHEGSLDVRWSASVPRQKICGPGWRKSRGPYSKFIQPFTIHSNNASLAIRFRMDPANGPDQVIEGAFAYYTEFDGQRVAGALCDGHYDGRTSPAAAGHFSHSYESALFWAVTGPFSCTSTFTPQDGQTVTLSVMESAMKDEDGRCYTECDRYGCHCRLVSNQTDMEAVDHVVLSLLSTSGRRNSTDGNPAICLCGNVQAFLPLKLTSNTPLLARHHVAEFTFGRPGLLVDFGYSFLDELDPSLSSSSSSWCPGSINMIDTLTGSMSSSNFGKDKVGGGIVINDGYYHMDCTWVATAQPGQQWTATIFSPEQGNCEDWNVTFHYYDESWPGKLGQAVHYLCPDVEKHVFPMPSDMSVMAMRLQAWSTAPVEYRIDWQTSIIFKPSKPDVMVASPAPGVQRSLSSLVTAPTPSLTGVLVVQAVGNGGSFATTTKAVLLLMTAILFLTWTR